MTVVLVSMVLVERRFRSADSLGERFIAGAIPLSASWVAIYTCTNCHGCVDENSSIIFLYSSHQELMKDGASNSALYLGTAFESERLRHFPYMDIFSSGEYPVRSRRKC